MEKKIAITSDCVCDLSEDILEKYHVKVIYFYIVTDRGWFKDLDEITSRNIVEYFENGGQQIRTMAPNPEEYVSFFEGVLAEADEIIHISISSTLSKSYENASKATECFGNRVQIFDSRHLSTGIGHLVIKAAQLAEEGKLSGEIIAELEDLRNRVSTTFIAENADYLYRTRRVSKLVRNFCTAFKIHPVLSLKDGVMKLASVEMGNYNKSVLRYVKKQLKKTGKIEKNRVFITHTICPVKLVSMVKHMVRDKNVFEEVIETDASATITSNCGANTIGVLFVKE